MDTVFVNYHVSVIIMIITIFYNKLSFACCFARLRVAFIYITYMQNFRILNSAVWVVSWYLGILVVLISAQTGLLNWDEYYPPSKESNMTAFMLLCFTGKCEIGGPMMQTRSISLGCHSVDHHTTLSAFTPNMVTTILDSLSCRQSRKGNWKHRFKKRVNQIS